VKIAVLTTDNRQNERDYSAPEPRFGSAVAALLQGLAHLPEHQVHIVSCVQQPVRSPEKIDSNIWYHSLHVPRLGWLRTGYQGCIRAVRAKLRDLQPDIAHGQGTERDCAISAVFSEFPNVVTVHGNMRLIAEVNRSAPFSFNWFAARLESFTLPRTDGVICLSQYTRQNVESLARKCWVVPNSVHESFFFVPHKPAQPPQILCVGHITMRKNQVQLIRALDPLAIKHQFHLHFFGISDSEPAYVGEFLQLVKQRDWCHFHGCADRAELQAALSTASLLILPSLEDNCPMTVLEAMAANVPVIGPRVGGVVDLIQDGVSGLLCDPTNLESIRGAVEVMLRETQRANAMADAAKKRALDKFHPRAVAEAHIRIYHEVVEARRNSG